MPQKFYLVPVVDAAEAEVNDCLGCHKVVSVNPTGLPGGSFGFSLQTLRNPSLWPAAAKPQRAKGDRAVELTYVAGNRNFHRASRWDSAKTNFPTGPSGAEFVFAPPHTVVAKHPMRSNWVGESRLRGRARWVELRWPTHPTRRYCIARQLPIGIESALRNSLAWLVESKPNCPSDLGPALPRDLCQKTPAAVDG